MNQVVEIQVFWRDTIALYD